MMNAPDINRLWRQVRRSRQFDAELRVNIIRIAAVGAFFLIHLAHSWAATSESGILRFFGLDAGNTLSAMQNTAVTCLVLAWVMTAVVVHQLLLSRLLPPWLMYASTAADLIFLTAALTFASGATSSLIVGYFLILIMSGLRFDLQLVRVATCGAVVGYLFLLGAAKWPVGLLKDYPLQTVPRYQQLIVVVALLLAGALVGQWIRHAQKLTEDLMRGDEGAGG